MPPLEAETFGADPPIGVFEQPPRFSGGDFEIFERVPTIERGAEVAQGIRDGTTDPFLQKAWTRMSLYRTRDRQGRYEPGFELKMEFVRPGKGEYAG